jgi:phosphoribosylaminoimidazole-succinocarboxamide synthase
MTVVTAAHLPLPLLHRGKVREMYDAGEAGLLMVASDRISAFDVILEPGIPAKGEVLTQLTAWWLAQLERAEDPVLRGLQHHALSADPDTLLARIPALAADPDLRSSWDRRSLLVQRTRPLPVECVVRGYLSGSAWEEYREHGTLAGEPLPPGLQEADALPVPLFSPATKAQTGHDENITFAQMASIVGAERAAKLREASLALYAFGRDVAARHGLILADTKFEFGEDPAGRLILIDEVLTPDSSRYWLADQYAPGRTPSSLDKQPVRDWLAARPDWDRTPPAPPLDPAVVEATTERYREIFRQLTGSALENTQPPHFRGERP